MLVLNVPVFICMLLLLKIFRGVLFWWIFRGRDFWEESHAWRLSDLGNSMLNIPPHPWVLYRKIFPVFQILCWFRGEQCHLACLKGRWTWKVKYLFPTSSSSQPDETHATAKYQVYILSLLPCIAMVYLLISR